MTTFQLYRRFIHGLDYIDELVAQVTPNGDRRYVIQDVNHNVRALVNGCTQEIMRQYRYSPYGDFDRNIVGTVKGLEDYDGSTVALDDRESFHGFQGLWSDGTLADPGTQSTGFYWTRTRIVRPDLERWMQRDMNGQGLTIGSLLAMNGENQAIMANVSPSGQYQDGANTYQFERCSPIIHTDPNGKFLPLLIVGGAIVNALVKTGTIYATGADLDMSRAEIWQAVGASAFVGGLFGAGMGGVGALAGRALGLTIEQGVGLVGTMLGTRSVIRGAISKYQAKDEIDHFFANLELVGGAAMTIGGGLAILRSEPVVNISPKGLRWSQTTAGGNGRTAYWRTQLSNGKWAGDPVDAVQTPEGITAIDNTRAAIALEQEMQTIPVRLHQPDDPIPLRFRGRFGTARTWGEALKYRTANQRPPLPSSGTTRSPILRD